MRLGSLLRSLPASDLERWAGQGLYSYSASILISLVDFKMDPALKDALLRIMTTSFIVSTVVFVAASVGHSIDMRGFKFLGERSQQDRRSLLFLGFFFIGVSISILIFLINSSETSKPNLPVHRKDAVTSPPKTTQNNPNPKPTPPSLSPTLPRGAPDANFHRGASPYSLPPSNYLSPPIERKLTNPSSNKADEAAGGLHGMPDVN